MVPIRRLGEQLNRGGHKRSGRDAALADEQREELHQDPYPDRPNRRRVNLLCHGRARASFSLTLSGRRDAARPDRAAWAVQRLLAAAATLSATGSASPRSDRTRWLGGLRRAFSPAFRAGSLYPFGACDPKNLARRKMAYALSISITH